MKWAHFIHMYQPSSQHPGTLEKIVNESYRPLLRGFLKEPKTKITININAVLTEMLFKYGYRDVLDDLKILVEMGRVELTGSAKYHSFLPLLPEEEVERQIMLNHETNKRYLGDAYKPKGFFSPEMGYSPKVAMAAKKMGYEWMIIDETAVEHIKDPADNSAIYEIEGIEMKAFFREKLPSNLIMGALVRTAESLEKAMGNRLKSDSYVVTAMDAETFGHHRPGLEEELFSVMKSEKFDNVLISELASLYDKVLQIAPKDSTWASSIKDVRDGNPFNLWFDKHNKIHEMEWNFVSLAINVVKDSGYSDNKYPQLLSEIKDKDDFTNDEKAKEYKKEMWIHARDLLDRALNSDPMWWSSAKPWWSVEMIEKGMFALWEVVRSVPDVKNEDLDAAEDYYKNILFMAHEWQRLGTVNMMASEDNAERLIPLSKRFGASAHYKALLEALKIQELKAAGIREYEQAIKWRDSQYKLERDLDIYDAVHVMDMFREEGDFAKFEELLAEYKNKYKLISKGQPE